MTIIYYFCHFCKSPRHKKENICKKIGRGIELFSKFGYTEIKESKNDVKGLSIFKERREIVATYSEIMREACMAAGKILMDGFGHAAVYHKGVRDLVTDSDTAAQKAVRRILAQAFPTHAFVGEEASGDDEIYPIPPEGTPYRWILDPLDGTTNYAHGSPHFCVSLALEVQGELFVSGIYAPYYDEFYSAIAGHGAWLNGKEIHVSQTESVVESLLGFGFPPNVTQESPDFQAFLRILGEAQAMRRTGSLALNLAYAACGRFDGVMNFSAHSWDVAAGVLLIKEAGGIVTAPDGSPFNVDRAWLIGAGTKKLHDGLLNLMN